jgi:hypothetical protein
MNDTTIDGTDVTAAEIEHRTIRRAELVPDTSAFIDTILPECKGKANYALIGPGVAENPDQIVPVTEPHGFNLGVAALPHGVTNSLHLHFTAEVFSCMSGRWTFQWGIDGASPISVTTTRGCSPPSARMKTAASCGRRRS